VKTIYTIAILLIASLAFAQCMTDIQCNDNRSCTRDICTNGVCDNLPILYCDNYQCTPSFCQPFFALQDTCNMCFWRSSLSGVTVDSIKWEFYNMTTNTSVDWHIDTNRIVCIPNAESGVWIVSIQIYFMGDISYRSKASTLRFDLIACNSPCDTNHDCDDGNNCTIDFCINADCMNKSAYLNGSPLPFEEWKRNCCTCN